MRVEVDTDLLGCAIIVRALAEVNQLDALKNRDVWTGLMCRTAPVMGWSVASCVSQAGFTYELDRIDTWTTVSVLIRRAAERLPIKVDCEDLSAAFAAAILLVEPDAAVEIAITQPPEGGMAHAYLFVNGHLFDPSVATGMRRPPESFYRTGRTARVRVPPICRSLGGIPCPFS